MYDAGSGGDLVPKGQYSSRCGMGLHKIHFVAKSIFFMLSAPAICWVCKRFVILRYVGRCDMVEGTICERDLLTSVGI